MDPIYAKAIGVDVDNLLVSQPDYGEQALEIAEMLVRSGALDIVVIDSVAALMPKAEIEGEMGDSFVGLQARLMSQALRKLAGSLNRSGTICCLHQPAAREDRRHVRQPRGHHRRQGAQVLRHRPPRHPPHRDAQRRHRGGRQPRARQGRQEQGRAAVQAGRVRHHVRAGHLARGHAARPRRRPRRGRQERRLLQLQRRAPRAGPRQRQGVPARQPRHGRRHRAADPREGGPAAGLRRRHRARRARGRARGRRPVTGEVL